ncbi:hypothetical protein OIU84_021489 [Salix udensis]|uniref:CRC domain-containing protein n=1 Tax=Salix udensis TaxID=889485 RepID=A0AAD6PHL6_9ROSI|nr:hypothetical protein OIU84_021489 [Salix udensis]
MAMDTPEKTQITSPLSKFEDSPVFNYINSLSPIKPVKSINIAQTFHSLSFASLPSVFTSPHVNSHKETRFLKRHNYVDLSKPEFSSENGNEVCNDEGLAVDAAQLYDNSTELQENFDSGVSIRDGSVEPPGEHLKFTIELPRTLKYDCGSPDSDQTPRCGTQADIVSKSAGTIASLAPLTNVASHKDSPEDGFKELFQKSPNPVVGFCTSFNEVRKMQIVNPFGPGEQNEMEDPFTQPGETIELTQMDPTHDNLAANEDPDKYIISNPSKAVSNLHRGMRRRCLDFEKVGARRKNIEDGSSSGSVVVQSDEKITYENKQLVPFKPSSDSSRCILPGIGLHLNALAINAKDMSAERDMDPNENVVPFVEDFSQTSPKKKRRRLEGEAEACKRCNCKKSKCLKLYCECFAAGVYCIEPCACQDCFNKPIHEDTVLATRKQIESRNPLAFAPKVIRSSEPAPEIGDESSKTPASARHKRGCNCKKSSCLKKYWWCWMLPLTADVKDARMRLEERMKTEIQNNDEQHPHSALPTTPLRFSRPLVQLPFSSKGKPPRSFLGVGSSSGLYTGQRYGKQNFLRPQWKFEKQFQNVPDDEIPEILRENHSPSSGIKTSSPNSKRVSPPQSNLEPSPGRRSGRKLILQSIPSFPSLTPHH